MSGRAHGDLPIRGGRGGDRGGSRGRGDGGSSSRGSDRGYSGDRGRGSDRGGSRGGRGGSEPPSGMLTDPVEAPNARVHALEDRYVVESAKPEPKKGQQMFVLQSMFRKYPLFNKGVGIATDGATEIVTTELFPNNREPFVCSMGGGSGQGSSRSKAYTGPWEATLTLESSFSPADMMTCLEDVSHRGEIENESPCLRVLNILMSAYPYRDSSVAIIGKGRNKFFRMDRRKQSMEMRGGAEAVRGYYSSVRLGAGRIFLNLNVSHGAFFNECLLSDILIAFVQIYGNDRKLIGRFLKGLKVHALHLEARENGSGVKEKPVRTIFFVATPEDGCNGPNPPRVVREASSADNVQFWMGDEKKGKYVTVSEYFYKTYNKKLKYAGDMPIVNVGTRDRPVYLPAEVCEVLPGQPFRPEPSTLQRQNMIKFSCRRPPQNYASIMTEGLDILGISEGHTKAVGIKPGKEMITVSARILNPPNLLYGGKKTTNPRNGSWNLINTKFSQGASIGKWTCLWLRKRGKNIEEEIARPWPVASPPSKPYLQVLLGSDDRDNREMIKEAFKKIMKEFPFLVVLLPTTEGKIFDYVKYAGDLKTGVLTHCMLSTKFKGANEQYLSNNAMKVNLKMGGCNQLLQPANARFIGAAKNTIVVGLDVTHPSSTDPEIFPSVAAIVASTDYRMGQWPGEVRAQTRRQESIEFLKEMMLTRLNLWQKSNSGNLPQNILVYRDGVSDGQFAMVLVDELPKIQAAAKADQDRTSNPINGCIVDRGVTRPIFWDFYLQAQAPLQGSARPAHYIVIHDEIFTNPKVNTDRKPADMVQELTHSICYLMGRATRSISYSTPAFLADKFCDRARKYLLAYYYENNQQVHNEDKFKGSTLNMASACQNSMVYI
ncbi:hypothetical protein N7453_004466 [Penicillium expansum]|nr:hypothetical protein N7453_004466 [Penicillium expansum]